MGHAVERMPAGGFRVRLPGEPPYCRALPMAPPGLEEELRRGAWLVLAFAAWSSADRLAIPVALAAVKRFGGVVSLGVRPFESPDEAASWMPDLVDEPGSPLWLVLRDGEVVARWVGSRTARSLTAAIAQVLALPAPGEVAPA